MIEWILLSILAMASATAYDFAAARYQRALRRAAKAEPADVDGAAHRTAVWSLSLYTIGLASMIGVLKISLWLAIPEAAGVYLGTWLGARMRDR